MLKEKKRAHKPIHIYDQVFLDNIWVSFGVSAEDYLKAIKDYLPKGTKPEHQIERLKGIGGHLTVYEKPDGELIYWIWVKENKDFPSLAHEAFHLAYTLLDNKGVQLCESSEEVFAYYIGMIVKKTLDRRKNEKVIVSN